MSHDSPIDLRGAGRPEADAAGPADVVFTFSRVTWQAVSRRGFFHAEDRLACSLVASDRIGRLVIANPYRHRLVRLARRLAGTERAPFPSQARITLLEPTTLRRRNDPVSVKSAEHVYRLYDRTLETAVRRQGLQRPRVITANPLLAAFGPLEWADSVTWYATDDWTEHPGYAAWASVFRECYVRIRERGCRVVTVSEPLMSRIAPTGAAAVIPNGVDPVEWESPSITPTWIGTLPRPIFVYAGALDTRMDIDQVRTLARAQSTGTVLFVGTLVDAAHMEPLRALPNVVIRPPVERSELPGLIRAADVGLLCHRATPLTTAMSPLKVYEYLAAGLPVLATDLAPVRALADPRITLVAPDGDIAGGAARAVAAGRASESEQRRALQDHAWQNRHDALLDLALA